MQKKRKRDIIIEAAAASALGAVVVAIDCISRQPVNVIDDDALHSTLIKCVHAKQEINSFNY